MDDLVGNIISKRFSRARRFVTVVVIVLVALQVVSFFVLHDHFTGRVFSEWLPELLLIALFTLLVGILTLFALERTQDNVRKDVGQVVGRELHDLKAANDRALSLQHMASTLSATLSFDRVVEQALDVSSLALAEMGIPRESLVGAVFLYEEGALKPIARRRFLGDDGNRVIAGKQGVIGAAIRQAEPVITNNPQDDLELQVYEAFRECLTAVCVPLRAGFQLFGAMVIGTDTAVHFDRDHIDLFKAVGDQTVIALQNAQLYQRLEAEKQRLIEADEEARKELARDLHDGPTQSVAAIAMRVGFARGMIERDPARAREELLKIEALAKQISAEIRGMLFTLRPLVLETQGLGPALDALLRRYSETDGVEMRLVGAENGRLLSKSAQTVTFAIIEEALNNARKYSRATLIEVRLWKAEGLFVAAVQDNGVGFDTYDVSRDYSTRGSLGMVNMRERAERIDGSLRVESSPEIGTTVTLVVPLDKHSASIDSEESPVKESHLIDAGSSNS
ncbi:MAG: GAF domain-containing sensor histidine kinase [Anaerolineae bacterium]|nr:GAF domain-containing sensor histidine kinase [Promineifilum sp.]MCZ2114821.1 GAF domain-containing sensor histidine kinase [Anaerolineae bacterium]